MSRNAPLLLSERADTCEKPEVYHQQTPELSLKDSNKHLIRKGGI